LRDTSVRKIGSDDDHAFARRDVENPTPRETGPFRRPLGDSGPPSLALALRDPVILEQSDAFGDFGPAYQYAFTTMFFAFVSFLLFRISDSTSHLFSVNDVLAIAGPLQPPSL
jgi:hypothetical protein